MYTTARVAQTEWNGNSFSAYDPLPEMCFKTRRLVSRSY